MLAYPARVEVEGEDMVMLTLPDVPELVVVAGGRADALRKAPTVLDTILAGYVWQDRPLPEPSRIAGAPMVSPRLYRFAEAD
ncbi:MAG: antitoxin HicB [Sphingomonadales bacterium]|jgi:predicted RNase H-like HicB family nuclease|nr:antitoxin HicB [Sphingomonadales bacterium]MEA3044463.1 antitoxin HicB [Sphingomonadales bacterium]